MRKFGQNMVQRCQSAWFPLEWFWQCDNRGQSSKKKDEGRKLKLHTSTGNLVRLKLSTGPFPFTDLTQSETDTEKLCKIFNLRLEQDEILKITNHAIEAQNYLSSTNICSCFARPHPQPEIHYSIVPYITEKYGPGHLCCTTLSTR